VLITFEGIDGCGKSTLAKALHEDLVKRELKAKLTKEPTRGPIGKVLTEHICEWDEVTIALLFSADHSYHVKLIRGWLKEGFIVISDRYHDSNLAYQGTSLKGLMEDPISWLESISEPSILLPDVTFLLRIDPERAIERIHGGRERYEEPLLLDEVQKTYLRLAGSRGYEVLDGSKSVTENLSEVLEVLKEKGLMGLG
jgi:dTMP kinase